MPIKVIDNREKLSIEEKFDILGPFLKMYGNGCMSYSTLQDNTEYFLDENIGYIAYYTFHHPIFARKGKKIVLSDPITAKSQFGSILESFLTKFRDISFLQISRNFAEVISSNSFHVNQLGIETEIELHNFSLRGGGRAKLRQWRNKCIREGVEVFEQNIQEMNIKEVKELSVKWLKGKGGHEFTILTRPLEYRNENDVRYFWAKQNGSLIGMGIFDPLYQDNDVIGYYHNFDRLSGTAPHGTSVSIALTAIEKFNAEGKNILSLGLSPLSHLEDDLPHNARTTKALHFIHNNCNFIYPFRGNASHKKKYDGMKQKVYFSCTSGNSLFEVLGGMKGLHLW